MDSERGSRKRDRSKR